jgi:eukaryotic-like serine/threonine-protein kinase
MVTRLSPGQAPDWTEDEDPTIPQAEVGSGTGPVALPSPWAPGTQFSSYEIESRLAVGGMAEVWRAKINGLQGFEKRIVIKTMLTQLHQKRELVEMFVREASLAARLSHPNIVDVLDFGQLEGRYFIAMEYVSGLTLRVAHRRMLATGRRLPIAMVLHVLSDLCEALQHVHDLGDSEGPLGLIHRDVSPENVIISTTGTAKLIDFGAARATARTPPGGLFVGKYRYSAPERILNQGEDCRSDVYSVGVILYECLVGRRPFEGTNKEVVRAATSAPFCDPATADPSIPASVAAIVRQATAHRPEHRFPSAHDLGAALTACLSELGASSKERDVTTALSALLAAETSDAPVSQSTSASDARDDGVPEAIGPADSSSPGIALSEREILEASGPLPREAPPSGDETRRVNIALPPEAFAPPSRPPSGPASHLFDRGIQLRQEGRFEEALAAWESALALAPENRLYDGHVRRLRAQLAARSRPGESPKPQA